MKKPEPVCVHPRTGRHEKENPGCLARKKSGRCHCCVCLEEIKEEELEKKGAIIKPWPFIYSDHLYTVTFPEDE